VKDLLFSFISCTVLTVAFYHGDFCTLDKYTVPMVSVSSRLAY